MLKRFRVVFSLLLIFGISATLTGQEETDSYFPHAIGSYWIYESQIGDDLIRYADDLTRYAVEEQEIEGEMYHAFNYEPTLEGLDYDYHIHPNFYQIGEKWITFLVGDDVEKAVKARLTKELESYRKVIRIGGNSDLLYDIEVEAQDQFYVLPTSVTFDEKWNAIQIKAKVSVRLDPPQDPEEAILEFTIVETGKVLGTESVETSAGTFEDCLKIEYRTEREVSMFPPNIAPNPPNSPGKSITTLWVGPNIGIVKFHQETEDILLKAVPHPQIESSTTIKTLELKKYEVKSTDSGSE